MSKHTPGPWEIGSNMILKMINGSYFSIAEINDWENETVPNARLIAAAPDLLQAWTAGSEMNTPDFMDWIADRLVNVYGENPNIDFVQSLRYRAKLARAAIAKAKGEV